MDDTLYQTLINSNLPEIDLHFSSSISEAKDQLEQELFLMHRRNEKYCRVIYGIGEGVLKKEIIDKIKYNPLVKDYKEDESGGSCLLEF